MRRFQPPKPWQRASLRTKTMVVTVVPVAVVLVAVALLARVQNATASVSTSVEATYRARASIAAVLQDLIDAETGVRGYLLTGDGDFLAPYDDGIDALGRDLPELGRRLDGQPDARERFDLLSELADERLRIFGQTKDFAARTPPGRQPTRLLEHGKEVMDEIRGVVARLDADQARALERQRSRLADARRWRSVVTIVAIPLALILAMLFSLRFTRRLVHGIRSIEENARRLENGEELLPPPSGEDELANLGHVLAHTAGRLAEQDAELRELALEDDLTGLPNRRAFLQIAEHELQMSRRRNAVTAILFVDADGLKIVNDRYGHQVGDEMLCELADVLRSQLRQADLVARIGGDEFVVLLSRDTALDGNEALERLRVEVGRRNAREGRRYRLDFSVGAAFFDPLDPVTVEELIGRADADMYEQKREKRLAHANGPWAV